MYKFRNHQVAYHDIENIPQIAAYKHKRYKYLALFVQSWEVQYLYLPTDKQNSNYKCRDSEHKYPML
jgi:hypothetical protein